MKSICDPHVVLVIGNLGRGRARIPAHTLSSGSLRSWLSFPTDVRFLPSIPRTSIGLVQRCLDTAPPAFGRPLIPLERIEVAFLNHSV
jgi:hypothetical protein